jgi:hypothetical protein
MKVRGMHDLVRRTLSDPAAPWGLLLRFRRTDDEGEDHSMLSQSLPWLAELGQERGLLCEDLHRYGLGVVACASEKEARQRLQAVQGRRLAAELLVAGRPAIREPLGVSGGELRKRHGVYTTPPPLVGYLVRSVHRLLQSRLGWKTGLADPRVRLLDPAAGAMNFVRAAWRLALEAHWHRGGEAGALLREHLLPHSRGIELLPEIHARGQANLRRFLKIYGFADPASLPDGVAGVGGAGGVGGVGIVGILGDALAPAAEILDFPANVVLGNPPWRGRSDSRGEWINGLTSTPCSTTRGTGHATASSCGRTSLESHSQRSKGSFCVARRSAES